MVAAFERSLDERLSRYNPSSGAAAAATAVPPAAPGAAVSDPRKTRAASQQSSRKARTSRKARKDGPVVVNVGDKVQVFWEAEGQWFAGEVVSVDTSDNTYEVYYFVDKEKHWHGTDMEVRTFLTS